MTNKLSRVLIAGTNSGVGKTSISLGITAALARRGLDVQSFKVGPDFLDPTYLSLASKKPCHNLDSWMMGDEYVKNLFFRKAKASDISVIEGVMGLYDGSDPDSLEGSSAYVSKLLNVPIVLVVNAHGMSRSLAALVKGYVEFEPKLEFIGIIANNCGSELHAKWISDSLKSSNLPPLLGAIERGALPELPSRHLGLTTADSKILPATVIDKLATAIEEQVALDEFVKLASHSAPFNDASQENEPLSTSKGKCALGIAMDEAFHFYYRDSLEELERRGCELVEFSPINDTSLPEGLDGIYIGGGYPEVHAEALSQNRSLLEEIHDFASNGRPVYAECGGLMYLGQGLMTTEEKKHDMAGILPFCTKMLSKRKALGYIEATLNGDSILGKKGTKLRGHEFHYSEIIDDTVTKNEWEKPYTITRRRTDKSEQEGFMKGRVLATYVHSHLASCPDALDNLIKALGEQNGKK